MILVDSGSATLINGTVTVSNTNISTGDTIYVTLDTLSVDSSYAHCFTYQVQVTSIVDVISFVINSILFSTDGALDTGDNSTLNYVIIRK